MEKFHKQLMVNLITQEKLENNILHQTQKKI